MKYLFVSLVSFFFLIHAAQANDGKVLYDQAVEILDSGAEKKDTSNAIELLEQSGRLDYAPAFNRLGLLYEKGEGFRQDYIKARLNFQKSADRRYPEGEYNLGRLYFWGPSYLKSDYFKAGEYFVRAAKQGSEDAKKILQESESGCSNDTNKMKRSIYCVVAAHNGYPEAEYKLGRMLFGADNPDNAKGMVWMEKAANHNYPDAILNLAVGYHKGNWVENDVAKSYYWAWVLKTGDFEEKYIRTAKSLMELLEPELTSEQIKKIKLQVKVFNKYNR